MQPLTLPYLQAMLAYNVTAAVRAIPMLYLQLAVLGLWITLFVSLKKLFKQKRRILIAILFGLLAGTGLMLAFKYTLQSREYVVTCSNASPVYSGPGSDFTQLGTLPAGTELVKLQKTGEFIKARHHGATVWIGVNHVKSIDQEAF